MEFLRGIATNGAGLGQHGTEIQAQEGEDARVGGATVVVFTHQVGIGQGKGLGVLRLGFARGHPLSLNHSWMRIRDRCPAAPACVAG